MKVYVVIIVCVMDDVIVGCYKSERLALRRMRDCEKKPHLRHEYTHIQSTDSSPVLFRVVSYEGAKAEHIAESNMGL